MKRQDANYTELWKKQKDQQLPEGRAGHRIFRACEKTLYDMIIVNTHHLYTCNHRMYNTKNEPQCKLWTLGDYVSVGSSVEFMYHSDNGLSTYGGRKHLGTLVLFVQLCNEPKISHWKKKESTKKKKDERAGRQYLTSYLDCNTLLIDSHSCIELTTMGQKSF